jgi:hypothetical protein
MQNSQLTRRLNPYRELYSDEVSGPEANLLVATARRVIDEASTELRGTQRDGVRVDGLFHYGAVDLDPRLLVVWILLSGKSDHQLPEWMPIVPGHPEASCQIDYQWLVELRDHIVQRFAAAGWPRPHDIAVYADSSRRVDAAGGNYFKG